MLVEGVFQAQIHQPTFRISDDFIKTRDRDTEDDVTQQQVEAALEAELRVDEVETACPSNSEVNVLLALRGFRTMVLGDYAHFYFQIGFVCLRL
jgi:hypothetical protein